MSIDSYIAEINQRRSRNNFKTRIFAFFILIFLVGLVIYSLLNTSTVIKFTKDLTLNQKIDNAIQKQLEGTKGNYAIVIKNLKTGENYSVNENKTYDAGSLYKLWVMAAVYQQIQSGILDEDKILSEDTATLNEEFNISSDAAELIEGAITLSVRDALNQMITISHNYAALLLTQKVKLLQVANFLNKYGFKESSVGISGESPKTTASDIALFFEKLYKGELANQENTAKMIELLKKQQLNDKLPKLLPQGTHVAHKTGEIDYQTHDGGIVYSPKGDYIIVIMSDSNMPQAAADREARVSKAVYDFFIQP